MLWPCNAARSAETSRSYPLTGELVPTALTPNTWTEYGGRVSFNLSPQVAADLSLAGVSGFDGMGTSAELRAATHIAFLKATAATDAAQRALRQKRRKRPTNIGVPFSAPRYPPIGSLPDPQ